MKIALIDNMNNNFFSLARYLKDEDIDVTLYEIEGSDQHFNAQADSFQDIEKLKWIKKLPTNIKNWFFFNDKALKKELEGYDLVVSCGPSIAYLERAGMKSDLIIPYGSDLYILPFTKLQFKFKGLIKNIFLSNLAKYQKQAFYKTNLIITDDGYYLYEKALNLLGLKSLNLGIPMLYNKEDLSSNDNIELWSFLDDYDFIVFNHSRQYWKSDEDALEDYDLYGGAKRNDKLIKAFAAYIKSTKFLNPLLVLFEYGIDVQATKELIKDLDLEGYVKWMPTMNRKNIMYGLSKATFASNAFRENLIDIGGVCYESLAVGTPLLNNCKSAIENEEHKFYSAPMIHALDENELLNIFKEFEKNPDKYLEIRNRSQLWFDKNLGIGLVKKYIELFKVLNKTQESVSRYEIKNILDEI